MEFTQDSLRLSSCIRDLISLSSLPAIWVDQPESVVCKSLSEVLLAILPIQLVYVKTQNSDVDTPCCEELKTQGKLASSSNPGFLDDFLSHLGVREEVVSMALPNSESLLRVAIFPIGIHADLGVIAAASDSPEFPDKIHSLVLSFVRNQAAFYFQKLRFVRQERAYAAKLRVLSEAALAVHSLNLNQALQVITDNARKVIGAHKSSISVKIHQDPELAINAISLSDQYAKSGPLISNHDQRSQSDLAVPLYNKEGNNIGVIQLSNKFLGTFTEEDQEILSQLSRMASVAIENAALYESLQEQQARTESGLREKEVLLRELHHRVKNNLQLIISLINLKSTSEKHVSEPKILDDVKNRIRALALLHEKFYEDEDMQMVDLGNYLQGLANELFKIYTVDTKSVLLEIECLHCDVQIGKALPLGLIVNELVSNSLKHAFKNGKNNKIRIELSHIEKESYRLSVNDNGVGLPDDINVETCTSFGLRLVRILVSQVDGVLDVQRHPGTTFLIRFSC